MLIILMMNTIIMNITMNMKIKVYLKSMKIWMIWVILHPLILKKKLKDDIKTQLSIKYLPSLEEFLLIMKKIDYP